MAQQFRAVGSCLGTFLFFFDSVSPFSISLLFPGAVGAGGFASPLNCSAVINVSLWTISFSSLEATPNYPGLLCRHQGRIESLRLFPF